MVNKKVSCSIYDEIPASKDDFNELSDDSELSVEETVTLLCGSGKLRPVKRLKYTTIDSCMHQLFCTNTVVMTSMLT